MLLPVLLLVLEQLCDTQHHAASAMTKVTQALVQVQGWFVEQ